MVLVLTIFNVGVSLLTRSCYRCMLKFIHSQSCWIDWYSVCVTQKTQQHTAVTRMSQHLNIHTVLLYAVCKTDIHMYQYTCTNTHVPIHMYQYTCTNTHVPIMMNGYFILHEEQNKTFNMKMARKKKTKQ